MGKILVVDDEDNIRALVSAFISASGYTACDAADVDSALELLKTEAIDMVITDLVMPGRDGTYLLAQIKARTPKLPVIFMTGKASVEAAVQCIKSGASDFLSKPLDFAQLASVIQNCLKPKEEGIGTQVLPTNKELRNVAGYDIRSTLGYGNFATVYLAEKPFGSEIKQVALKVLRDQYYGAESRRDQHVRRFTREAETVALLDHPNIVKVYEFSSLEDAGVQYIAMEYVKGWTLKDKLPEMPSLSITQRLRIVREMAAALAFIHEKDLCHRDVKPHNVMLTESYQVKLTDFGVVKTPDSYLTGTSQMVGTLYYMAPEMFTEPSKVDGRADLFSLGVVAYELFLGRRPFEGDCPAAVCRAISYDKPEAPRRIDPSFDPVLENILGRLLRKKVKARYQSGTELIADIDRLLAGGGSADGGLQDFFRATFSRDWN